MVVFTLMMGGNYYLVQSSAMLTWSWWGGNYDIEQIEYSSSYSNILHTVDL